MHPDDASGRSEQASLLASTPDAVYHLDRDWRITYVNPAGEALLARSTNDLVGRQMGDCLPALRGSRLEAELSAALADGRPRVFEYRHEPWERWYEVRANPDSRGVAVFARDIEDRRRTQQRQAEQLAELAAVLEGLPSPTVLLDRDGRILIANRAWTTGGELFRQLRGEPAGVDDGYFALMGRALALPDLDVVRAGVRALLASPPSQRAETFAHDYPCAVAPDVVRWFHLQGRRVEGSERVVITHTDITERVQVEQRLAWQAAHDDLTGLPNRTALLGLVDAALDSDQGEDQADGARPAALLFLDLDGFKTVNDSLGHEVGDTLLKQVAGRLLEQVRPGDAVGRMGGDQFLVLALGCDTSEAAALAFRIQRAFTVPFPGGGIDVPLSASIGVAVAHPGERDGNGLLSDADAAMYAAKAAGRDRVHLFAPELRDAARWRLEVATRLGERATDQLVIHYQPLARLDTGAVEGVEALLRWQHPERGLLLPDTFLDVAEETGQLIEITRWLLRQATRCAADWVAQGLRLRLSVNISARHFSTETLVHDVRVALRESGLPPELLVLELTETSVAEDPARAEDQLSILRGLGVRVAIDDFGTGWSSLAQLMALPIGTLKIDRSLLSAAEQVVAGDSRDVLAAIVALTRTLGIRSVAEGVETPEHLRLVRAAGCDYAQGWLIGHPMPADELSAWLRCVQAAGGDRCALALQAQTG